MRSVPTLARLRRLCSWRRVLAFALLAAVAAGLLAVPERARRYLEETLATASGGQARVAALHLDPWRLAARVDGLYLTDGTGALLLAAESVGADLAIDSLWTRSLHLESVDLRGVRGRLELLEDGALRPQLPAGTGGKNDTPLPRLRIDRVELAGGALAVRDASARPAAALRLTDLRVTLTGLDTAGTPAALQLAGRLGGGRLRIDGTLAPAPLALDVTLAVQNADAGPALAYLERALPLRAQGGRLDAAAALALGADDPLRLSDGRVSLRGAVLADAAAAPLAEVGELRVEGLAVDLAARRLAVGGIRGRDNWLALTRAADGRLNLQALTAPAGAAPPSAPAPAAA
ncbi:DUF748 domain-containing protein, partial [Immundisolibacter sp.]|uniref:DUF748 domain-containing protein n=1 Tax=Immundisolibacter sp. TaxID=1934948 RepID=UPI00262C1BE3